METEIKCIGKTNKVEVREIIQDMVDDINEQPCDRYAVLLTREKHTNIITLMIQPFGI